MNNLTYKGYSARVEFDAHDRIFVGHLAGVRDIVGFHGSSVTELEKAFHEAVDDYLAACKKLGQTPNKPASGRVMLRLPPELHARASARAEVEGVSFNQWAAKVLNRALQEQ
jgi:predicted HicB family RNase H-like nuclease